MQVSITVKDSFDEFISNLSSFFSSFPGATNETLLQKFNSVQKENPFYEKPQRKENAFIIKHYAGKVKYQVSYYQSPHQLVAK